MAVQGKANGGFECSCPECGWTLSCPDLPTAVQTDLRHRAHNCFEQGSIRQKRPSERR